jgi:hypothetical protein
MLESIKNEKTKLLENLKAGREAVEVTKQKLADEKYAVKRISADSKCQELTAAFDKYKQEKLSKLNEEFVAKSKEVAESKANILAKAESEAETEAAAEVAEYDNEIAKLEAELT